MEEECDPRVLFNRKKMDTLDETGQRKRKICEVEKTSQQVLVYEENGPSCSKNKIPNNKEFYDPLSFGSSRVAHSELKKILEKDCTDVLLHLTSRGNEFYPLLVSNLDADTTMLIAELLAKASKSPLIENKAELFANSIKPCVLEMFSSCSCDVVAKDLKYTPAQVGRYFQNLSLFYQDVVNIFSNAAADVLKEHLIRTMMAVQSLIDFKNMTELKELTPQFKKLCLTVMSMIDAKESARKQRNKTNEGGWSKPSIDFREVSVFPSPQEILSRPVVQLIPAVRKGPYQSIEHYLNVQYHLMREDFLILLRKGIRDFKEQSKSNTELMECIQNLRFYKRARFVSQMIQDKEEKKMVYEVHFDSKGTAKNINWNRSKRILNGSLICFSNDSFTTIFFGVVANRDIQLLREGKFHCELLGEMINEGDLFHKEYIMVESEVCFKSYYYTLKALKLFDDSNFPLKEYIIDVSCASGKPNYLADNLMAEYTFKNHRFQVSNIDLWPDLEQLQMNKSQFQALYSALTQKVALIHGPPGTGKKYLGLNIVKMLLENSAYWRNEGKPILVVCYTNCALDQLLEGILDLTEKIVRIGDQSKNEKMQNYDLKMLRNNSEHDSKMEQIKENLDHVASEMVESSILIKELTRKSGIISLKYLKHGMGNQYEWFSKEGKEEDVHLVEWLFADVAYKNNWIYPKECCEEDKISPDMKEVYACSLMEKFACISKIEYDLASPKMRNDVHKYVTLQNHISEYMYLKSHLNEQVCEEHPLFNELLSYDDLEEINQKLRWVLYNYWLSKTVVQYENLSVTIKKSKSNLSERKLEIQNEYDLNLISKCDVVGMTTTGAAKQQRLLQDLGPKIVIVEEAAEVMESHVLVSLSAKCEHLIMIGDHKQLRPATAVHELSKDYNMHVSLFERLLDNGLPSNILNIQHRMRPEIADLITPAIYPFLENHGMVLNYENVLGLKKNIFFLTHANIEEHDSDNSSWKNIEEGKFLIALSRHLILQGYDPSQITILTTYAGQMFFLMEERDKFSIVKSVRVTVVDNYQGEENDIILLSLVRNNAEGEIGFLGNENRICVALSRAKKGLFIMGNIDMLTAKSPLWQKIKEMLKEKEAVGTELTLQCVNHPSQLTTVCKAEDFLPITEGGCTKICDAKLDCGHFCKKVCHMTGHVDYKCEENCERMCVKDHKCGKHCWQKCGLCWVLAEKKLPCNHSVILPCHVNASERPCTELVTIELPECKHIASMKCYINPSEVTCLFPCATRLVCGHACPRKCHARNDPDHLDYKCSKPCSRNNLNCRADHRCQKKCFEECEPCSIMVERKLPKCDHFCLMKCCTDSERKHECSSESEDDCSSESEHECSSECGDECIDCQVKVTKEIPDCKHKIEMECYQIPTRDMCTLKCERILSCGHVCENICGLPCAVKCLALTEETFKAPCEHDVRLRCSEISNVPDENSLLQRCRQPCSVMLECGHLCKGTCKECIHGRIHIPCQEICGKILICGHSCQLECSKTCSPCQKDCYIKCEHSRCSRKCGYPCYPCKERCEWKCVHYACEKLCGEKCNRPPCEKPCQKTIKCGHPCIGFCGEKCPKLCRICDAEELEEILHFFGSDVDLGNARFVMLRDCKHTFDSKGLVKWMDVVENVVKLSECPQCRTPVQNVNRYGNRIKENLDSVLKVKETCCGLNNNNKKDAILKSLKSLQNLTEGNGYLDSKECLQNLNSQTEQWEERLLDNSILTSFEARIKLTLSVVENYNKWQTGVNKNLKLQEKANSLIKAILSRLECISPQEHNDLSCECMRFHLQLYLGVIETKYEYMLRGTQYTNYQEIRNLVYDIKQFPKDLYNETYDKIDSIYHHHHQVF